jgi:hypothetical protein
MEHSVHLSASKVVESVSPVPSAAILKRIWNTIKQALDANTDPDLDQVDADLATLEREPRNNEDESDNDGDFGSGDAVGKALALVKQVSDARPVDAQRSLTCPTYFTDPKISAGPRLL